MKRTNLSRTHRLLVGAALINLTVVSLVQAGDVAFYGIGKNRVYEQDSASAVTAASSGAYSFSAFAVPTTADSLLLASVTLPSGDTQYLDSVSNGFQMESPFATQTELNTSFPSGQYTFTAQSMDFTSMVGPANLTLSGDAYPSTTPQISNYTAAQSVDATKDFVVSWNAFANATVDDFVQLKLLNDSGDVVFDTGSPGQATALPGTARSATILANQLTSDSTYDAALSFGHITSRDATDYPGGTGVTTYAQETHFTVVTTGGTGGIPDFPMLMFSNPSDLAKNVPTDSPVVFTFLVPMAPVQSVTWSPNVVAANFTYTWGPGATNLTAKYSTALPANATITWTLDPTVFKSQSGTPLMALRNSGSFTTGSGQSNTNNPCNGGSTNTGIGSLFVSKNIRYVQTNANPPVVDTDSGAVFSALLKSPATNPVTQATLQLPNGAIKTLTNLFGTFMLFEQQFASQEALDAAYPAGNYIVSMTRTTGTAVLTLSLAANGAPPTPQITDFAQTQNFDPTANLTVQWLPFTGAIARDSIFFDMSDTVGTDFHAPDPCIPRDLPNTATSIIVPKNTFGAGADMDGLLAFTKLSSLDTNSVSGLLAYAEYSKTTSFKATTSGGSTPNQPTIQNLVRLPNGTVQFQVNGTAGKTLSAEASTDLKTWTPLPIAPSTSGLLQASDPQAASMPYRFYRGKQQ